MNMLHDEQQVKTAAMSMVQSWLVLLVSDRTKTIPFEQEGTAEA